MKPPITALSLVLACLTLANCTTVQPFERGYLAKKVMIPNRDSLAKSMTDHMYFSREAAFGGEGVGGGGCGCNYILLAPVPKSVVE